MPATIQALQEGRYTIEQDLPSVENFTIFQAFDTNDEVPVAIVEVPIALSRIATAAQREAAASSFAEHAKRLAAFAHKSVVAVRGHFTEDGRNYLVTDAIDGVDLAAVLAGQQRPVPVPELTEWADAVLDALNLMHNSRPPIVYRNVRPGNIVLRSDRTVQLTAAGMFLGDDQSSSAGAARGNSSLVFSPLEQIWSGLDAASQKVILSKYDDASERNLKQAPDARSDIFSLGATLYNLSTGQTPADALERSIEMIEGNPDPLISPNKLVPEIPFEVSDVIMKAMEIKREYRFDSAAIMRQVLKTALVRVKEREAEESLVQAVEAHSEGGTSTNEAAAKPPVEEKAPMKQEPARPERKPAAPAAPKNDVPPPARKTETFTLADLEDDLLGLMSSPIHGSDSPQHQPVTVHAAANEEPKTTPAEFREPEAPASNEPDVATSPTAASEHVENEVHAAESELPQEEVSTGPADAAAKHIVTETKEADASVAETSPEPVNVAPVKVAKLVNEPEPAEVAAEISEPLVPLKMAAAAAGASGSVAVETASQKASPGGLGLPAIAAAAVVLLLAAVGGWFYFGSNSTPKTVVETPAAAQPAAAPEQQAPPASQSNEPSSAAVTTQTTSGQATAEQPPIRTENDKDHTQKTASAVEPKAKKPEPAKAKTPEKKKAVTVDDLINDN